MRECVDFLSAPAYVELTRSLDALNKELRQWLDDRQVGADSLMWARLYFSDPANQMSVLYAHPLYSDFLCHCALSCIGQPMLNGAKVGMMFCADMDNSIVKQGMPHKMQLAYNDARLLYHSVRLTDEQARALTVQQQTELLFESHISWLAQEGLTLRDNCVRTWLFVRDIDRNYHAVMQGRNAVFAREGLTKDTHFIASTGIGGYTESPQAVVGIDFLSADYDKLSPQYLKALDYLNPTHQYGVAFERGVVVQLPQGRKAYISGTASIDRCGNCLHGGDVMKQADRLFENIAQLLNDGQYCLDDIAYLIVYLRDIADYEMIESYVRSRFPSLPMVICEASVCRPQWLVEVECVAR